MHNRDVAEMLDRTARILALRGENRYRIRAYQKAARAVSALSEDIGILVQQNRVESISGVGAALADKIREIVKTGKLAMLERLETTQLPAAVNRSVLLASALTFSREFLPAILELPGVIDVQATGGMRRSKETVEMLEYVICAADMQAIKAAIDKHQHLSHVMWDGQSCCAHYRYGVPVCLHLATVQHYTWMLWQTTGSQDHIGHVEKLLSDSSQGDVPQSEENIYKLAGLPLIAPELREDRGEIAAAQKGILPNLLEARDLKGDLHTHSNWSDGTASVEEMAETAVEMGYEYLAVTDHSRSLKVARGLSLERLAEQKTYISNLKKKYRLRILTGIEADILDDGSVDAPDEVLAGLDVVIASVHSGFRQSRDKLTARICRAMQNPYVQIIGHVSGRLLGKRDPYDVDLQEIIRAAASTGTALEINSSPDRLDMTDTVTRQAKEAGVAIAINTDAHSRLELSNMLLGLSVARRGWLESKNVINTAHAEDIVQILQKKRTRC